MTPAVPGSAPHHGHLRSPLGLVQSTPGGWQGPSETHLFSIVAHACFPHPQVGLLAPRSTRDGVASQAHRGPRRRDRRLGGEPVGPAQARALAHPAALGLGGPIHPRAAGSLHIARVRTTPIPHPCRQRTFPPAGHCLVPVPPAAALPRPRSAWASLLCDVIRTAPHGRRRSSECGPSVTEALGHRAPLGLLELLGGVARGRSLQRGGRRGAWETGRVQPWAGPGAGHTPHAAGGSARA